MPQTHHRRQRNYDPPPSPSEISIHSTPHISPQQGSSNTFSIRQNPLHETQFHTSTTPIQSHQTLLYLPAQSSVSSSTPPILTINTLHTNPKTNVTTSRNLSRPPSPLIESNPLSYSLTSTNLHSQFFSNNIQSNNINIQWCCINFQPHIPSTTTQTIPHIQPINTQPQTNALNIPSTSFNPSTTHTLPPTTLPLSTLSTPTYIKSATSISEPIKPFDGLDHNYTTEEYLQHIEARVTFSLGLQPTTVNEYKFWQARLMAFIQCSLTGTALSWYIRLNDTYTSLLYKPLKNNFHHKKTLIMHKLKLSVQQKSLMKRFVNLHLKSNNSLKKAGVMKMHQLSTLNAVKSLPKTFSKTLKILQIKDKLNILLPF